jgi:hypothetical protein
MATTTFAPTDFLTAASFENGFPVSAEYAREQFEAGLAVGNDFDYVVVSVRDTWGAGMDDGSRSCSAYERLGYHAGTADLWRGVLSSGTRIKVCRYIDGELVTTWIENGEVL